MYGLGRQIDGPATPEKPAASEIVLKTVGLSVAYGAVEAVRALDLEVAAGEIVVLLGANGAGKSSMLNAIVGLAPRVGGQVTFEGRDITRKSTEMIVRSGISFVPEGRRLFSNMTVWENLRLGGATLGPSEFDREFERLHELFPILRKRSDSQAGLLSGGEQQQVAIARALVGRPRLLLLDEPSLGLAPIIVNRVFEIIEELRRRKVTILLVEQNAERALKIADRGYVMSNGAVKLAGAAADLRASKIEAAYFGTARA